jgi:lantibiotic modifying enzyme
MKLSATTVETTISETAAYILATADYSRDDRLWPADARVFATNPLSVAYGACGPALFLDAAGHLTDNRRDVLDWMLAQPLSTATYPPGLYVGLAGVAYAFDELGLSQEAEDVMRLAYDSPLLYEEAGMFLGTAGWGLASLHFHSRTGAQLYLEWAIAAGEHLMRTAEPEDQALYWPTARDRRVHYGFGYGASGIALFLAYLHAATGDERFRDVAERAVEFDLSHRAESKLGWAWPRFEGDNQTRPYWIEGNAGIGSVLVRLHHLLRDRRHLELARRIAADTRVKFTISPGLFEGLSGIAEFMLDMHIATGDTEYLDQATDMAETLLWFKIPRPEGAAWPGRWLNRISDDLATGGAGVGLFLERLLWPTRRLLLDIGPLDRK